MKRSWIFNTLAVVVLLSILLAFASNNKTLKAAEQPVENDSPSTAAQGEMSSDNNVTLDENNDFACNLFRTIYEQQKGKRSIFVSPISVGYLLGMLHEAAGGETRRQINDVLGLGGSVEEINMYFKKKMEEAAHIDSTVTLKTANCIFFKSGSRIIPQYKADMQDYYNAWIEAIDLGEASVLNKINNWCKTNTGGMIPEILKNEDLNPNRMMYLLNAVYFKASWTTKFNPKETRDKYFTKRDGTTVKHKMMHLETKAAYGENELCQMLCLPYGNKSYRMYVLLPRKGKTIDKIIQNLSANKLEQMRKHEMATQLVDIFMPRFSTESETGLIDVLSAMGMPSAFASGAEFPNMLQGHKDDLFVSMMKQKAKIEVSEEGTKAAAVTIAEMSLKCEVALEEQVYKFHATHPFVYLIVENNTGTIYFMGTYCGEEGFKKVDNSVRPDGTLREVTHTLKEEIYPSVEQMPQFPGGEAALMKYIQAHIKYPPTAVKNHVQGRVIVRFVVRKDGSVGVVHVVRSVDEDLDREAVRVCKSLPTFTPGRQNGELVDVFYTVPVAFKLPQ